MSIENSKSILHSLSIGISEVNAGSLGVVLGDTLIKDSFQVDEDFAYVHPVSDSSRWCLAVVSERYEIVRYIEKQERVAESNLALCGYYAFTDSLKVKEQLDRCLFEDKDQMSDLLGFYHDEHRIIAKKAKKWFDFGNIDNLIDSKQRLLQTRFFNKLTVDPLLNTITKVSEFDEKLRNELNWYESLPSSLQVISPRIISKEEHEGKLQLVQEYYGYPTLAELYTYSAIDLETWSSIINKLLQIHKVFRNHKGVVTKEDGKEIYLSKTKDRIEAIKEIGAVDHDILSSPELVINGQVLMNLNRIYAKVLEKADCLTRTLDGSIIHGDFCFGNILFDYNNQIIRLIDPRGSFGSVGIYGDPRYDIAKLRHSISGLYDFIIADLFEISIDDNVINFEIYHPIDHGLVEQYFDDSIKSLGYDLQEIKFIEGLLFITMIPLHLHKSRRQLMMYLTGLKLLNEVF